MSGFPGMKKITFAFVLAMMLSAPQAFAACSEDVDAFAAKYHIQASIPKAGAADGASTSAKLAASGGVIAPPATGDMPTVTPAVKNTDSMMTAPAIQPQVAGEPGVRSGDRMIANVDGSDPEVTSLVQAARAAANQGHETDCQQRLADALKLVAQPHR